jgi:hypothetical protein
LACTPVSPVEGQRIDWGEFERWMARWAVRYWIDFMKLSVSSRGQGRPGKP